MQRLYRFVRLLCRIDRDALCVLCYSEIVFYKRREKEETATQRRLLTNLLLRGEVSALLLSKGMKKSPYR